eukprot:TRINITY_DN25921_c0_g1_i2.p1 TRINITY_DN25921_c0_g1~~TRINITY_DN25921_c0_g1_i2.p1  ORF type:complete len:369 (-),score=78.71 TRINITY_DN25921_c0_g1_i2:132-1238(-)
MQCHRTRLCGERRRPLSGLRRSRKLAAATACRASAGRRLKDATKALQRLGEKADVLRPQEVDAELARLRASGLRLDVVTCSTAINALGKSRLWAATLKLLTGMRAEQLCANAIVCTCAIAGCAGGPGWHFAMSHLEDMRRSATELHIITFNAALQAFESGARWQLALRMWRCLRVLRLGASVVTYNTAIDLCGLRQEWHQALLLFARSVEEAPEAPNVITYNSAVTSCEKSSEWSSALHLWQQAASEADVITRSAAVSSFARAEQWLLALWSLETAGQQQQRLDVVGYNALTSACEKASHTAQTWAAALWLVGSLLRAARLQPSVVSYTAVLTACGLGRKWAGGLDLLGQMAAARLHNAVASDEVVKA